MKRKFTQLLKEWKNHSLRVPLIVRGARQVGKTFSIISFGKKEFDNLVNINFEETPHYQNCFESLNPNTILSQIEILSNQKIIPGKTLLFLDEIQHCPKALQSLRYFKEKLPDLHVIAAGSLLEFTIRDEAFSFPVGRVQFARLYPLSFEEYLEASEESLLIENMKQYGFYNPPPLAIHTHLINRLREYYIVGGMPAAVFAYLKTKSYLEVKYVQKALWDAFENDFGKYARNTQHHHLKKIFENVPRLLGDHVKYSRIDPELPNPARDIKKALELLRLAGLIHPIHATSAGSIPLMSGMKETIFKLLFLDIGLVEQAMDIDPFHPGLMSGPLAEQFVGQEMLASADPYLDGHLYFWTRDNGSAEVDYLFAHRGYVFPIEVKAGKIGKLKSLRLFIQEKKPPFGIKLSVEPLHLNESIYTVPLYLAAHLPRLIDQVLVT